MTRLVFTGCLVVALGATAALQAGDKVREQKLQQAIDLIESKGDLPKATPLFEDVATSSDRALAARGLLHLAQAQERYSTDKTAALSTRQRIVTTFGASSDPAVIAVVEAARKFLPPAPSSQGGTGAGAQRNDALFPSLDTAFNDPSAPGALSPDGQWIALTRGTGTELVLRALRTGAERNVPTSGGTIMLTSWAPNSSAIAFFELDGAARTAALRVAPAATAVARTLMTWANDGLSEDTLLWSPTSDRIAFTTKSLRNGDGACPSAQSVVPCRWDVRVAPVRPGPVTRVGSTWASAFRSQTYFAWSPDGLRLAFHQRGDTGGEGLRIVDVATQEGTLHAIGGANLGLLAWTAHNELLLSQGGEYLFMPAGGADVRKAAWVKGDELVAIGPGAEWFIVQRASTRRLLKKAAANGSEQTITTGSGQETNARLSPDGRLLAFASNRDGKWALYVAPLDQVPVERPLRLASLRDAPTNRATAGAGGWGTDGTLVTSFATPESHLYRVPIASDRPAAANATQATVNAAQNMHPAMSPDGQRIAFVAATNNRHWITVMDVDGRNERPLLERDVPALAWRSPKQLLIKDGRELVTLDADSGAVAPLPGSPAFDTPRGGTNWAYVPERDEIVYVTVGAMPTLAGGTARFFAHALATGETRELGTRERVFSAGQMLAVAPGGGRLAFVSGGAITIMSIATSGDPSTDRVLGPGPQVRMSMTWAPDGTRLVACLPAGRCEIVDAATGAARPLLALQNAADRRHLEAAWSPNGAFVLVTGSHMQFEVLGMLGVTAQAVSRR